MKIMFVIHSLIIGGAEMIVTNYLIQLRKMGQEVVLLQMTDKNTFLNRRLEDVGIRVLTAAQGETDGVVSKIKQIWHFRSIVKKENPDVMHVHTGLEKFKYINYPAKRIVYTVHSEWKRCINQGKNHRKMLFRLIEKGMSVVALTEQAGEDILNQCPRAKVVQIPNGVDFESIRQSRYDRTEFLVKIGIPQGAFVVGHIGRFHIVKNHEKLIEIFVKIAEKRPDAYLLLVGDGERKDKERICSLIKKSGVADRIYMLGERADATAIMSTFDCFVLPSQSESFSLVLIEAKILGVKAVISDAIPKEVREATGFTTLSILDSSECWAEHILDSDYISANNTALEKYALESVMEEYLTLYSIVAEGAL